MNFTLLNINLNSTCPFIFIEIQSQIKYYSITSAFLVCGYGLIIYIQCVQSIAIYAKYPTKAIRDTSNIFLFLAKNAFKMKLFQMPFFWSYIFEIMQ